MIPSYLYCTSPFIITFVNRMYTKSAPFVLRFAQSYEKRRQSGFICVYDVLFDFNTYMYMSVA